MKLCFPQKSTNETVFSHHVRTVQDETCPEVGGSMESVEGSSVALGIVSPLQAVSHVVFRQLIAPPRSLLDFNSCMQTLFHARQLLSGL